MMKKQISVNGWTTGRMIAASATLVVVVLILSATAIIYGISSTVGVAIKSNPELLSAAWLHSASEQPELMAFLLSRYLKDVKGGIDGTGQIDGSFTGRFTTTKARSLEKINLSCVTEYEYVKSSSAHMRDFLMGEQFLGSLEFQSRLKNKGCSEIGSAGNHSLWSCPLNNCAMREIETETAGLFIPEKIDIRRVQAGVSSQLGK